MKKTVRHKATISDLALVIPSAALSLLFASFFLVVSGPITFHFIQSAVRIHTQLHSKELVSISILIAICAAFTCFCGFWIFRTVRTILQKTGMLEVEKDVLTCSEVADIIDQLLIDQNPFGCPIESLQSDEIDDTPFLSQARDAVCEILTQYEEYGSDEVGLRPDHIDRLKEISHQLRAKNYD